MRAAACVIYTPALSDYWISQLTYGKYLHRAVTRGSLWLKKKRGGVGGQHTHKKNGAVSTEPVPLQLSEAKVSLGSFPTRTSILSTVLVGKVFCIHNALLSQEERPIAAEQQLHLSLKTYVLKVLPTEILLNKNKSCQGNLDVELYLCLRDLFKRRNLNCSR